jgi:hypothetical protein
MRMHKPTQHYSESFRRMVIEEHLLTGIRKADLLRKYNIKFKDAINTWMRLYGYISTNSTTNKNCNFIYQTALLPKDKNDILTTDPVLLLKKIKELERQLEDEQIRSEGYSMMLDIVETEYKIPIRKKQNTK